MATQYLNCPSCNAQNDASNTICLTCGSSMYGASGPMQQSGNMGAKPAGADKKIAAGICGILLGGLGIHKFVLGYQNEGIIMLAVYLIGLIVTGVTCGIGAPIPIAVSIVGIVEGIIYLTKSDEEFSQTYIVGKKPWF